VEKVIASFKNDKFSKSAGIEIIEVRPGFAKCIMAITDNHLNGLGIVMGGAIFTLADFTFSLAATSHGIAAVTLNAFISYLKKCNHGVITAIASEVSRAKRTGVYHIDVFDENSQMIATVTGTCHFK
jgi:acyl-CoA thioesterase